VRNGPERPSASILDRSWTATTSVAH